MDMKAVTSPIQLLYNKFTAGTSTYRRFIIIKIPSYVYTSTYLPVYGLYIFHYTTLYAALDIKSIIIILITKAISYIEGQLTQFTLNLARHARTT